MSTIQLDTKVTSGNYLRHMVLQLNSGNNMNNAGKACLRRDWPFLFPQLNLDGEIDQTLCLSCAGMGAFDKRQQIRVGGSNEPKSCIARVVALNTSMMMHGALNIEDLTAHDTSHLCNARYGRCFRKSHLTMEPNDVNTTRRCCHMYGNPTSASFVDTYVCPHEPACIFSSGVIGV